MASSRTARPFIHTRSWYSRSRRALADRLRGGLGASRPGSLRVIINPAAGPERPFLKAFNNAFKGLDWDMVLTKEMGDGERFARQAVRDGVEMVAVYGGDGTLMDAAAGMLNSGVPLGIIPGGTGNIMAMDLTIPPDIESACRLLVSENRRLRQIDVGLAGEAAANAHASFESCRWPVSCAFLLRAGVGIEADVIENTVREAKDRYGIFAYIMHAVQALTEPKVARYYLNIDGLEVDVEGLACVVANAGSFGVSGLSLANGIDTGDGILDVFVLRRADLMGLFSLAASIAGASPSEHALLRWKGTHVRVYSDPVQSVQADGELFGTSPLHARILPQALTVVVPPPDLV